MTVISLFDGMSCGRIALERLGIKVDAYYASEIDKYAMQVAKKNYPDTVHIGDVTKVSFSRRRLIDADGNKYRLKGKVIVIGGSPCQGFSFAGKQLNFDDPRSKLFFDFVRLIDEVKPDYFFLENVRMKKEYQDVITEYLKVEPIMINSDLLSAQNRVRIYWTNIPNVTQPEDKGIVLKDILESDGIGGIKSHGKVKIRNEKAMCLDANYFKGVDNHGQRTMIHIADTIEIKGHDSIKRVYHPEGKSRTLTTMQGGHREPKVLIVPENTKKGYVEIEPGEGVDLTFMKSKTRRGRAMRKKSNCLTATAYDYGIWNGAEWRKLTPVECERLQTVPDNYTDGVSNTQRYKMLGNGWTVDVIAHIFRGML